MAAQRAPETTAKTFAWKAMRAVWWALALVHVWPLCLVIARLVVEASVADAAALAVLVGVTGLFLLKAVDARMLRLQNPGLDLAVFILAAALVHGDVVGRGGPAALSAETTTAAVAAATGATLASRRARRRLGELLRTLLASFRAARPVLSLTGTLRAESPLLPERLIVWRGVARAPPARVL